MKILKNKYFFIVFFVFFGGNLFAKEATFWTGYAGGKEIRNAWVIGSDPLFYDVSKNIILGFRTYFLTADRKEYKIGNGGCNYWSIMVGGRYQTKISKKFEFNTKFFTGTGSYDRKGKVEGQQKEESYTTASLLGCDLSVGMRYNFTRKFGIGLDLGYRYCCDIQHKTDDKFDLSGYQATLNLYL
ncbi:MAG: outer membrane beta-barrel protein [Endomicrobium sp.]|jgi:hypothetical protein|nr:outer membrane beta-barrel protein [Endomicrobium sp.]